MKIFSRNEYLKSLEKENALLHEKAKGKLLDPKTVYAIKMHDEELKCARKCDTFAREFDGKPKAEIEKSGWQIKDEWCIEKEC